MSPIAIALMLALGLLLTVKGGDLFVDAAVWMAEVSGLPKFLIGATLVSVATTLPELAVSLLSAARGSEGIAAGNAVGSVAANLGLILGISLCAAPGPAIGGKLTMMAGAAALLLALCMGGKLRAGGALILLGLCAAFLAQSVSEGRRHMRSAPGCARRPSIGAATGQAVKFIAGAAGIAAGARLLSDYGAALARLLRVPEGVIGATVVAVGTSLPELVTTLTALSRGQASLSVGNVVGANIIDLTLILPLCALANGGSLSLPRQSLMLDMPFCLALCLIAVVPTLLRGRFSRTQGVALLGVYALYVAAVVAGS